MCDSNIFKRIVVADRFRLSKNMNGNVYRSQLLPAAKLYYATTYISQHHQHSLIQSLKMEALLLLLLLEAQTVAKIDNHAKNKQKH